MVGVLIRLKVALARNQLTGSRAAWALTGTVVGATLAAGVVLLALLRTEPASIVPDLLATAYLTWLIGWIVGPVWAAAPVLRPAHFTMLPIPRHTLALGLLTAGFVGFTAAVTLLAFASLVVYAGRLGVLPVLLSVPVTLLQVTLLVLVSRVAHVAYGRVARARLGAGLNGILLAVVMVLSQSGWMVFVGLVASGVLEDGFPAGYSSMVRWVPSGWGLVAVESAGRGDWPLVLAAVAGLLVLSAVLLLVWSTTLGEARGSRAVVRGSAGARTPRVAPFDRPEGVILLKELRSWWRDPARTSALTAPLAWGVLTAVLPLVFGAVELVPFAGALVVLMAATYLANVYSFDGTGIWLTIQTGTARVDVRARQWAYLLAYGPIALLVTVGFTLWSGLTWAWPWALTALAATLGGGAGLVAFFSVYSPAPGPDARERSEHPAEGSDQVGAAFLVFFAGLVPAVPGLGVVLLGSVRDSPALQWAGLAVGSATGVLLTWGLGRLAAARLEETAPDLLLLMRTGRAPSGAAATPEESVEMSGREQAQLSLFFVLGILALIPQGLLTMVFKLTGNQDVRVWFLAMYLPEPWGWLTSVGMVLLGIGLLWLAFRVRQRAAAGPSRAVHRQDADSFL